MDKLRISILIGLCAASLWPAGSDLTNRGREVFDKRCGGCHALDNAKVGPPLRSYLRAPGGGRPFVSLFRRAEEGEAGVG